MPPHQQPLQQDEETMMDGASFLNPEPMIPLLHAAAAAAAAVPPLLSPLPRGDHSHIVRVALLGTGMMGREHCSYILGYPSRARIDFLCDPHPPSLEACLRVMEEFQSGLMSQSRPSAPPPPPPPRLCHDEDELLQFVHKIDLLVIATPNDQHTHQLLRWGTYPHLTVLVEKPVAVNAEQHGRLMSHFFPVEDAWSNSDNSNNNVDNHEDMDDKNNHHHSDACPSPLPRARIWVAMEYRFIPAIARLLTLLPTLGDIKMVTIRENRYPFLEKIGGWNRDKDKTGDTLVEKCCHFFDLFRLITGCEAHGPSIRTLAQRGVNYIDEPQRFAVPILDSAYVLVPFLPHQDKKQQSKPSTTLNNNDRAAVAVVPIMGCLELCMYAEGSRHQEEIIVTGSTGRLEAYLPENTVYSFTRPSLDAWKDRTIPPPPHSIQKHVYDCSNVHQVFNISNADIPTNIHAGYHYSSTALEWYELLLAMDRHDRTGIWEPRVSLLDGLRAVEIGLKATEAIDRFMVDATITTSYSVQ